MPDVTTSIFEEIPTDRDHFVLFDESVERFGIALVAYAVLVVLAAPRDIIRAPVDCQFWEEAVEGRFGFLSHESSISQLSENASEKGIYFHFFSGGGRGAIGEGFFQNFRKKA